jgi:hypothetical protein
MRRASIRVIVVLAILFLAAGCSQQRVTTPADGTLSDIHAPASPGNAQSSTENAAHTTTTAYIPPRKIDIDPNKKLVFDNAHKEIFTPLSKAQIGYSAVDDMFKRYGYATSMSEDALDSAMLAELDAVVIAGPMDSFSEQEVNDLVGFVSDGGDLLITLHLGESAAKLVERFGMQISSSVIAQAHDTFEDHPKWFITNNIAPGALTEGVTSVAVQASWGLLAVADNAKMVVSSAPDSWADVVPDDIYDRREPVAAYGLVGAATHGKGRVVVVADDAVLTNKTIEMASNRRLLENILIWFEESKK